MTAVLALGAIATYCEPPPAPTLQQQVISITNQRRAEAGLAALTLNNTLVTAAQRHAEDQASVDTMSHTGTDGSDPGARIQRAGYPIRAWGENVAGGYGSAESVMGGWMASSGHRENLLNPTFTQVGIGLAYAADGTPYWAMELGLPR